MKEESIEILQDEFLNTSNIENIHTNYLLNYALHYASIGYPIFPLHNIESVLDENSNEVLKCSCSLGFNCNNQGKHPRTKNGFKDATTDEEIITDWWKKYTKANIGILTGKETGIFVLDVDLKHFGERSLKEMQEYYRELYSKKIFEPLPETLMTKTGSGGRHIFFKYLIGQRIESSIGKIGKGLDIRADGGYIIAPPSNHLSGKNYEWISNDTPIEDAPKWLIYEILKSVGTKNQTVQLTFRDVSKSESNKKILDGERNTYLFKQACGLVNTFSEEEVLRRILIKNQKNCVNPLSKLEVEKLITSANKYRKSKNQNMGIKK